MAVHIDLDRHGKPGLNPHMDQAEVSIHEVEVQVQTLPPGGFNERTMIRKRLLKAKGEGAAGFKDGVNTHQAMLDSVTLSQFSGRLLFVDVGCEILEWPSLFLGHRDGMVLHAFRVFQQEWLQGAEILIQTVEELSHRPTRHDGEIAAKYHAVETREYAVNPIFIFADEFLHGSILLTIGSVIDLGMIQPMMRPQ